MAMNDRRIMDFLGWLSRRCHPALSEGSAAWHHLKVKGRTQMNADFADERRNCRKFEQDLLRKTARPLFPSALICEICVLPFSLRDPKRRRFLAGVRDDLRRQNCATREALARGRPDDWPECPFRSLCRAATAVTTPYSTRLKCVNPAMLMRHSLRTLAVAAILLALATGQIGRAHV